jgi:LmbE family N-acetylglucosaminyl deacetylase
MPARRLLAILAHPDDESLGLGGTLAKYATEGVEICVVTATRGEGGRYRGVRRDHPDHPGMAGLGVIRERELRAAIDVLGVRELALLGYVDQELDRADPAEVIGRLAAHIRRTRPHVVVTFGPDGAYGHPDHIAISQFTTAAVVAAADASSPRSLLAGTTPHTVAKLYYLAWSAALWAPYEAAFGRITPIVDGVERHAVYWPEWAVTTTVDTRAHWETAWKAIRCHESQVTAYGRLDELAPEEHEVLWGSSSFYRAFSTVNGGRAREHDLFEGMP